MYNTCGMISTMQSGTISRGKIANIWNTKIRKFWTWQHVSNKPKSRVLITVLVAFLIISLFQLTNNKITLYRNTKKLQSQGTRFVQTRDAEIPEFFSMLPSDHEELNNPRNNIEATKCPKSSINVSAQTAGSFHKFGHDELFLYSASVRGMTVTIIGLASNSSLSYFNCSLIYSGGTVISVHGKSEIIGPPEGKHRRYRYLSRIFTCPLPSRRIPQFVSFTKDLCGSVTNKLVVLDGAVYKPNNGKKSHKLIPRTRQLIAICVMWPATPYASPYPLVEWLEMQNLLGADQVIMYGVRNVTSQIGSVLRYYVKQGFVTILPWTLPWQRHGKIVWQRAQLAAMNDCLYRYRRNYRFMSTLSLNQFIVPHQKGGIDFKTLLQHLIKDTDKRTQYASFSFSCTFFCTETPYHQNQKDATLTLKVFLRSRLFRRYTRPILDTSKVHMISSSEVLKAQPGILTKVLVPMGYAYLHDYRVGVALSMMLSNKTQQGACPIEDRSMLGFQKHLKPSIMDTLHKLSIPFI